VRRRAFLTTMAGGLLAAPLAAEGQQAKKVWRIGYLTGGSAEREKSWLASFRQGLRELGYVERESIVIEQRYAEGRTERLPELTKELIQLKVDVLVAAGDSAALAAKKATSSVPVVFVTVADPVGLGIVVSLARPGGNVTGLSDLHADIVTKRLELLKEIVPSASRVAVLLNPVNPAHAPQLRAVRAAAPALGLTVLALEVREPDDINRAFAILGKERASGLLILGDRMLGTHVTRTAELAIKSRQPTMFTQRGSVEAGGLMSYGANFAELYRQLGTYIDRILKGTKPADLPIEQATKFELVINLKTAKALGLTIPPSLLSRADEVIQ